MFGYHSSAFTQLTIWQIVEQMEVFWLNFSFLSADSCWKWNSSIKTPILHSKKNEETISESINWNQLSNQSNKRLPSAVMVYPTMHCIIWLQYPWWKHIQIPIDNPDTLVCHTCNVAWTCNLSHAINNHFTLASRYYFGLPFASIIVNRFWITKSKSDQKIFILIKTISRIKRANRLFVVVIKHSFISWNRATE